MYLKNFRPGGNKSKKNGRLITSHRSTTYSCCLPALGGFSRSWSCKTCRRKDKGVEVNDNIIQLIAEKQNLTW